MKNILAGLVRIVAEIALLLGLGAGVDCIGQDPPPDLSQASLEELGKIKVYSASKHLQLSGDAPSSITVISAAQIQEHGFRTLADVLRTVRGFYVTYDRNYSSLGVRGFARPGDYNTRILLLVDGHRLNDDVYDDAMIGTEFPIDIDLIERIEIVRGPASSLYGSNALFATINIFTKQGEDVRGADLSSDVASFDTYKGRVTYGQRLQTGEWLLSGSFYGSRGASRLFFPDFNSPQTNNGIAQNCDDDQLGSAFASASFHGFTLESGYGTREKGVPTGIYGTIFNNPGTRTTDSHAFVDLRYDHKFADGWDLSTRVFADRYMYQGTYVYPSPTNPDQISPNLDFADGKWWGAEIQASRTIFSRNRITGGSEFRDNTRQSQTNYNLNPYSLGLQDQRNSYVAALYIQDEVPLTRSIALNAGIRYDYYSSVDASSDPRVAVIYRPSEKTSLKAIYGEAFRIPNVYEKFYSVPPNAPNPELKPEKMRSEELIWEQALSPRLSLSTSAYHSTMADLITQQPEQSGLYIFQNLQNVAASGVELELRGQLQGGFEGTASYSFQESKDTSTNQLLNNSPRNLAKLNLTQPLFTQKLFLTLDGQYRGRMESLAGTSVSPFSILNFTVLGRRLGRHADLSASVYNLLDKTYFDPPSSDDVVAAIQQDRRTFRVKFTWRLGDK